MSKAIIHIGFTKTGSTSIQKYFCTHLAEYEEKNIFIPKAFTKYGKVTRTSKSVLITHVWNDFNKFKKKFKGKFSNETEYVEFVNERLAEFDLQYQSIGDSDHKDDIWLFSNEGLAQISNKSLNSLKDFLDSKFSEYLIIAYIRHPLLRQISRTSQQIKGGKYIENIYQYANSLDHTDMYRNHLQRWLDVFGRKSMVVRKFSKTLLLNASITEDFCNAAKIEHINSREPVSNKSLSFEEMIVINHINRLVSKGEILPGPLNPWSRRSTQRIDFAQDFCFKYFDKRTKMQPSMEQLIKQNEILDNTCNWLIKEFFPEDSSESFWGDDLLAIKDGDDCMTLQNSLISNLSGEIEKQWLDHIAIYQ